MNLFLSFEIRLAAVSGGSDPAGLTRFNKPQTRYELALRHPAQAVPPPVVGLISDSFVTSD